MELRLAILIPFSLFVLADGDLLGSIRNLWYRPAPGGGTGVKVESSGNGNKFAGRRGYYDDDLGDSYMVGSHVSSRGGGGWGWGGWGHDDHQNLDLYSLLGGLSFASLLGATIIYLARRNTSGRRRRSLDGTRYLEEDEVDTSADPETRSLNILELIDTFLENARVFSGDEVVKQNESKRSNYSRKRSVGVHLGPGVVPHKL